MLHRVSVTRSSLDSHPFFPARTALGHCTLTASAVCVPAGVFSASAEPSIWHTGVVLAGVVVGVGVGVGVILRLLLPIPLRTHPPHASLCFRVCAAQYFHPSIRLLVVHHVPPATLACVWAPPLCGSQVACASRMACTPFGLTWVVCGTCAALRDGQGTLAVL